MPRLRAAPVNRCAEPGPARAALRLADTLKKARRGRRLVQIRVDGWKSAIRFDAAHVIPHHPKCGRLHGHTYALHAHVEGRPDPTTGIILDFSDVKKALKQIADRLDHHVLVQTKSQELVVEQQAEGVGMRIGEKRYVIPYPDAILLPIAYTTAEGLAEYVADELVAAVDWPDTVDRIEIGIDETYGKGAWTARTFTRED